MASLLRHRRDRLHRQASGRVPARARGHDPRPGDGRARARRLEELISRWGADEGRIVPVVGDLTAPLLGVSDADRKTLAGVDHFFHLAAVYDMEADDETNRQLNVEGTRNAVGLANDLGAKCFHHTARSPSRAATGGCSWRTCSTRARSSATRTRAPSSSPRSSCARSARSRGASTARGSSSATRRPARWTRSTGPTTSSR